MAQTLVKEMRNFKSSNALIFFYRVYLREMVIFTASWLPETIFILLNAHNKYAIFNIFSTLLFSELICFFSILFKEVLKCQIAEDKPKEHRKDFFFLREYLSTTDYETTIFPDSLTVNFAEYCKS